MLMWPRLGVINSGLDQTKEYEVVKKEMLSPKKASALTILLSTILLINMLLFGIVQSCIDSDMDDDWLANYVSDEADSKFSEKNNSPFSLGSNQQSDLLYLVINEFMADNGITVASPDGNSPDWIELFNAGSNTIDLTGMYLTDDLSYPTRWQFPEGTTIGPEEYYIIWLDRDGGGLYASFALNANGEEIGLFDSNGRTLIDSVEFLKQIQDVSYGRSPDGGSSWNYLLSATPGFSNEEPSVETKSSVWVVILLIIAFLVAGVSILLVGKIRQGRKK